MPFQVSLDRPSTLPLAARVSIAKAMLAQLDLEISDLRSSSEQPSASLEIDGLGEFDFTDVVDLTPRQIRTWMEPISPKIKAGLRVFAENGPIVDVRQLYDAGIDNIGHFQSRTTTRTRTVMGDASSYMLEWDDTWDGNEKDGYKSGRYAVTLTTYHSLRVYFDLD